MNRRYYLSRKEKILAQKKKYHNRNKEEDPQARESHREELKERGRRYRKLPEINRVGREIDDRN